MLKRVQQLDDASAREFQLRTVWNLLTGDTSQLEEIAESTDCCKSLRLGLGSALAEVASSVAFVLRCPELTQVSAAARSG
eukprot:199878-Rhodomonas_salina.1